MAYLKERVASEEYKKALMERHPLMNASNAAGPQAMWSGAHTNMGAVNQAWPQGGIERTAYSPDTRTFTVEKVDNGFILRSGKYSKICKDMDELKDQFIATIVEQQLDK